jgi:predicted HicB family RNase H-like nuclease
MDKKEYFKLTLEQKVNYINKEMKEGKSFNSTCKEISIVKGDTLAKLKKHGYKLIDNQYILKQIPEKQNIKEGAKELQLDGVAVDDLQDGKKMLEGTSNVQKAETTVEQINEDGSISDKIKTVLSKEGKPKLKAKVGRPQKYKKDHSGKNIDKKKFTLEIDKNVYKALKHKKIKENIAINIFVEDLLRKAIEDKYFKNVD